MLPCLLLAYATSPLAVFPGDYGLQFINYMKFDATGRVMTQDIVFDEQPGQFTFIETGPRGDIWTGLVDGRILRYFYQNDPYGSQGQFANLPRDKYFLLAQVGLWEAVPLCG